MNKIDLNKYQDFVQEVTSQESNDSAKCLWLLAD